MKVRTRRGMSILVCILAIGQTVLAASEAELLYGQAQELERQGRRSDAVSLYRQIVQEYPGSPEAGPDHAGYQVHFADLKAAIYAQVRDRVAVQSKANAIRQLASSPARKLEQLWGTGVELEQHGFYEEARLFYSEIIEKYPDSSIAGPDHAVYRTHLVDLRAALDAKDIVAARSAAEAIRQLPSSQSKPWQLYRVGKLLEQNHLYEDALSFLWQVINDYPDSPASGEDDVKYLFHSTQLKVAAEAEIAKMKSDFADHPELPARLLEIGHRVDRALFRSICQQIVTEFPKSPVAVGARTHLSRLSVEDLIEQGNTAGAEAAIAQMKADFADHGDLLSARLYQIGCKYQQKKDRKRFHAMCRQITNEFPDSFAAIYARLYHLRFTAEDLVVKGDDAGVEAIVSEMIANFSDNPELPDRLFQIACKYKDKKDIGAFRMICQQIIAKFPDSSTANLVRLYLTRFAIDDLMEQGDVAAVKAAIVRMKTDFAGSRYLSDRILDVIQAMCAQAENSSAFRPLCRQLLAEYGPARNRLHIRLLATLSGYDLLDAMKAGDTAAVDAVVLQVKDQYADTNERAYALHLIAERLYMKAQYLGDDNLRATAYLKRSVSIYEEDVLGLTTDDNVKAGACYVLALNYRQMEDYLNAAGAFARVYALSPRQPYAGYCLYSAGLCYDEMMLRGEILDDEGRMQMFSIFEEVVSAYPSTPEGHEAQRWLREHKAD